MLFQSWHWSSVRFGLTSGWSTSIVGFSGIPLTADVDLVAGAGGSGGAGWSGGCIVGAALGLEPMGGPTLWTCIAAWR